MLSVREVAEILGVCTASVHKLIDRGELAHVRVGNVIRVAPADLKDLTSAASSQFCRVGTSSIRRS